MNRTFGRSIGVASAMTCLVLTIGTPSASASASGCVDEGNRNSSCIKVDGSGTHVNWIQPGSLVAPLAELKGRFFIYDSKGKIEHRTKVYTYRSYSLTPLYMWGDKFQINKDLPAGDKVCVRLEDGAYHPPACKTIKK